MLRTSAVVLLFSVAAAAAAPDQLLRSGELAAQLVSALQSHKLDAIAVQDPDEPDRFVAALFYANSQLLVVSARSNAAPLLKTRLTYKQYRDIYVDLQGAPVPGSSVFFQDMKADGLCASRDQVPDVLYPADGKAIVFDGNSRKGDLSKEEYDRQLAAADRQYSRLLELLLAQAKSAT